MVIVCTGGRDHAAAEVELAALWWAALRRGARVRVGCARGVDLAVIDHYRRHVGPERGSLERWMAPWEKLGRRAGLVRNGEMLRGEAVHSIATGWGQREPLGLADVLVHWPGGRGTANCVEQATGLGVQRVPISELVAAFERWRARRPAKTRHH